MLNTENIQNYLKEIELMPFAQAFETVKKYPDTVKSDVNMLQAVFVKLFMQDAETQRECGKRYAECGVGDRLWENHKGKDEILSYFKENFDSLYYALQIVFRDGYLEFIEALYDLRLVPIFASLNKQDELEKLYAVLNEHEHSYNVICRGGTETPHIKPPKEYSEQI